MSRRQARTRSQASRRAAVTKKRPRAKQLRILLVHDQCPYFLDEVNGMMQHRTDTSKHSFTAFGEPGRFIIKVFRESRRLPRESIAMDFDSRFRGRIAFAQLPELPVR